MPSPKLNEVYSNFDAFLGEAVRRLWAQGQAGSMLRVMALAQTVGKDALVFAMRWQLSGAARTAPIAAAAAAVAATGLGALAPHGLLPLGLAGFTWLATARSLTPLRHHYAGQLAPIRGRWHRCQQAWLEGTLSRNARECEVDALLEELVQAWAKPSSPEADGLESGR